MKLTPQLQYIQEACIKAAHPGLSLDEAKSLDYKHDGCLVCVDQFVVKGTGKVFDLGKVFVFSKMCHMIYHSYTLIKEVIGLPPTLARVLNALGRDYEVGPLIVIRQIKGRAICHWRLLNDDGSDATLFDQSEETIDVIAKELGYRSTN